MAGVEARRAERRNGGTAERRNGGTAERRNGGTAERRNGGTAERRNGGTAERRNGGTAERRNGGTAERRNGGPKVACHPERSEGSSPRSSRPGEKIPRSRSLPRDDTARAPAEPSAVPRNLPPFRRSAVPPFRA